MPRNKKYTIKDVPPHAKIVEVYGTYTREVNELERVLKTRVDGIKQHYWVKTGRKEIKSFSGRMGFYGSGYELAGSIVRTENVVPKENYQIVPAREFNKDPYKFGTYGKWVMKEVESG